MSERYVVVLVPVESKRWTAPAGVRLRAALKAMGRAYGLRAASVRAADEEESAGREEEHGTV